MLKNSFFRLTAKMCGHSLYTEIVIKKFYFFFTQYKNDWKGRKFRRQNNQKNDFYKNKKVTKIDEIDVNKILISEEEPYGQKILSNTLLDTIMMMLSNHYA